MATPTTYTYPGVYLTETEVISPAVLPAPTNQAAFVGVFPQGPEGEALKVSSLGEFEQYYGIIEPGATLAAYAVQQFFANGGTAAWIVRLPVPGSLPATAALGTVFTVSANSPGAWGNQFWVEIDTAGLGPALQFQVSGTNAQGTKGDPVEVIGGINPNTPLALIAANISKESAYVTVEVQQTGADESTDATTPPAPLAPQTAVQLGSTQQGADGAFEATAGNNFTDAVANVLSNAPPPLSPLDQIAPDVFNIMAVPDAAWFNIGAGTIYNEALQFCAERQAFMIVDPPPPSAAKVPTVLATVAAADAATTVDGIGNNVNELKQLVTTWGNTVLGTKYAESGATYYPWVMTTDPNGQPIPVPPSGAVAGVYASTDVARGVWKAPAGTQAKLVAPLGLADTTITDTINGDLNTAGINVLRTFPTFQTVVWGARTLMGSDLERNSTQFTYVAARRLTDFIEQSLMHSLRWAVFEPNGPPLWGSLNLEATQFMVNLYAAGAFEGATQAEAFTVSAGATPQQMAAGVVNLNVAFTPIPPAEFVVLNIKIPAGAPAAS